MKTFYDGNKILSLKDSNKQVPEIYLVTSNRSAGKSTYFSRYLVNRWKNKKENFILLYRYKYELKDIPDKFFAGIKNLFYPSYNMSASVRGGESYAELFINDRPCGHAIAINSADAIKKYSAIFHSDKRIFFDEFQSETENYCTDEIKKFQSIHQSVARGNGKQSRYVPVIMCSNFVSVLNPYYKALGVMRKITPRANFVRGNGWVLEQSINDSAKEALQQSTFARAFKDDDYQNYSTEKVYLLTDNLGIESLKKSSAYIATIILHDKKYALRESSGLYYINDYIEDGATNVINFNNPFFTDGISQLKFMFYRGLLRFSTPDIKYDIMDSLI